MLLRSLMLGTAMLISVPVLAQQAATPAPAAAPATISDPAEFVAMAGSGNTFEIQSSTMAKETSQNQEVTAFADQMIADHTKAAQDMAAAASAESLTPPDDLNDKHQEMLDGLDDAEGEDFDAAYLTAQVAAHDEAVALFEGYVAGGPDGALKDFATATLPTLKMHQQHVHELAGQ